jgi:hypothetical protein
VWDCFRLSDDRPNKTLCIKCHPAKWLTHSSNSTSGLFRHCRTYHPDVLVAAGEREEDEGVKKEKSVGKRVRCQLKNPPHPAPARTNGRISRQPASRSRPSKRMKIEQPSAEPEQVRPSLRVLYRMGPHPPKEVDRRDPLAPACVCRLPWSRQGHRRIPPRTCPPCWRGASGTCNPRASPRTAGSRAGWRRSPRSSAPRPCLT